MGKSDVAATTPVGANVMVLRHSYWARGTVVGHVERVRRRWPRKTETMTLVEAVTFSAVFGTEKIVIEASADDVVLESGS